MSMMNGIVLPAERISEANEKTALSLSLYMHIIISTSLSESRIFLASAEEFAHMNFGGLLRLSSRYSSVTWISIRPSSSRVKAS